MHGGMQVSSSQESSPSRYRRPFIARTKRHHCHYITGAKAAPLHATVRTPLLVQSTSLNATAPKQTVIGEMTVKNNLYFANSFGECTMKKVIINVQHQTGYVPVSLLVSSTRDKVHADYFVSGV